MTTDWNKIKGDQRVVAIIPARGGSKGLPRKNIRPLAGRPLLAYAIEAAKQCEAIDRIIVTTDDKEIADVALLCEAEVPFFRSAELSGDYASTEATLLDAVEWLEREESYFFDILVYLQVTDVFRKRWMVDSVVRALLEDPTLESAFIGYRTHKNYWAEEDDRFIKLGKDRGHIARQLKEPIYREDTGLACATRVSVIKQGRRLGDTVKIFSNDDDISFIDIHDAFDLWLAEQVITHGGVTIND